MLHQSLRISPAMAMNVADGLWWLAVMLRAMVASGDVTIGVAMVYYLVHRFGPTDKPQFRKEEFSMEPEAISKACTMLAAGEVGDFVIEDDEGKIITT